MIIIEETRGFGREMQRYCARSGPKGGALYIPGFPHFILFCKNTITSKSNSSNQLTMTYYLYFGDVIVELIFINHFIDNFNPDLPCTYHFLCPCPKCAQMHWSSNFTSIHP